MKWEVNKMKNQEDKPKKDKGEAHSKKEAIKDDLNKLVDELESVKKKSDEYLDGWKRAQADYINLKKRIETDMTDLTVFANADLISRIIPVLENFRRASTHAPEEIKDNDWVSGIKQIEKQLEDVLKNEGLERINIVGKEFDPNLCEAVCFGNSDDHKEDEVIEELESGYILKGKVLIPVKVKVCKK